MAEAPAWRRGAAAGRRPPAAAAGHGAAKEQLRPGARPMAARLRAAAGAGASTWSRLLASCTLPPLSLLTLLSVAQGARRQAPLVGAACRGTACGCSQRQRATGGAGMRGAGGLEPADSGFAARCRGAGSSLPLVHRPPSTNPFSLFTASHHPIALHPPALPSPHQVNSRPSRVLCALLLSAAHGTLPLLCRALPLSPSLFTTYLPMLLLSRCRHWT